MSETVEGEEWSSKKNKGREWKGSSERKDRVNSTTHTSEQYELSIATTNQLAISNSAELN